MMKLSTEEGERETARNNNSLNTNYNPLYLKPVYVKKKSRCNCTEEVEKKQERPSNLLSSPQ